MVCSNFHSTRVCKLCLFLFAQFIVPYLPSSIKARIARLHRWSKDEAAKPKSSQPTLLQLWETQQAMRDKPTSRYEALRKLREQAALYNLLAANGITTMQQLHEKVDAMNAQYYKLRGEIVSAERRIATLEERLDMFENTRKTKRCSASMSK